MVSASRLEIEPERRADPEGRRSGVNLDTVGCDGRDGSLEVQRV